MFYAVTIVIILMEQIMIINESVVSLSGVYAVTFAMNGMFFYFRKIGLSAMYEFLNLHAIEVKEHRPILLKYAISLYSVMVLLAAVVTLLLNFYLLFLSIYWLNLWGIVVFATLTILAIAFQIKLYFYPILRHYKKLSNVKI